MARVIINRSRRKLVENGDSGLSCKINNDAKASNGQGSIGKKHQINPQINSMLPIIIRRILMWDIELKTKCYWKLRYSLYSWFQCSILFVFCVLFIL